MLKYSRLREPGYRRVRKQRVQRVQRVREFCLAWIKKISRKGAKAQRSDFGRVKVVLLAPWRLCVKKTLPLGREVKVARE